MPLRKLPNLLLPLLLLLATSGLSGAEEKSSPGLAWPQITKEARPWAYWWWMGSAVDAPNLAKEMQRYHDGGLGGMHIIPIYGAKGFEDKYIDYLSPKWMEMMGCAATEARKRGMDVDMTLGSGWCFGGPTVTDDEANARAVIQTFALEAGKPLSTSFNKPFPQALVAYSKDGKCVELTDKITADGKLSWAPEGGAWTVYALSQRPSGQQVKRAAPGGKGHMLNPFYGKAIDHYLERFTKAFADYKGPRPRAIYHDSYEYSSNWSPDLFKEFEQRRGYRLQEHLPALFARNYANTEEASRVRSDYRETVSDMMVENFNPKWIGWAHEHSLITRDQAHGSPGNLLDLYGANDVPETEMFNTDRDVLVAKASSSAAHVMGRKLVASETGTWLAEHFTETLGQVKDLVDELFVSGINHVVYHGCCYSPDEAAWPGWHFYASTEMNPRNSIWRDAPALNGYIARCQAVLQSGRPANDILLYWPIHDMWMEPKGTLQNMVVHKGATWIKGRPFGAAADMLWKRGFTFDYISDRMVAASKVENTGIVAPGGGVYQTIVVPECKTIPPATLQALLNLAKNGATVIFEKGLPQDVPGMGKLEARRAELKALLSEVKLSPQANGAVSEAKLGQGRVLVGAIEPALGVAGVVREAMADQSGVLFIRRAHDGGRDYFVCNRGTQSMAMLPLAGNPAAVVIMDPMTGKTGLAAVAKDAQGNVTVSVPLPAGASVILRTFEKTAPQAPAWTYLKPQGAPAEIKGTWQVKFIEGGPALPKPFATSTLASWTAQPDPEAQRFAGAARYSLTFDAPASQSAAILDLGKVCQSARVKVNGQDLGTLFAPPFQIALENLKPAGNTLEVEVTNVTANRIRDLDRRKVVWKTFTDINIVNMNYKPLDASDWPLADSGLLGPVTLTPAAAVH